MSSRVDGCQSHIEVLGYTGVVEVGLLAQLEMIELLHSLTSPRTTMSEKPSDIANANPTRVPCNVKKE